MSDDFYADARARADRAGNKIQRDWTPEEIVDQANGNHVWINAFSLVGTPDEELLANIGRTVVRYLRESSMVNDLNGSSKHVYVHFNAS